MQVGDCMKKKVITVPVTATIADASALFCTHHIGMLPVIDADGLLVGILQLRDLVHIIMPSFVDLIEDIDYIGDFGATEDQELVQDELNKPVTEVMEEPTSVLDDSGLLRAFANIHKNQLTDLPIVNSGGQMVGLASRVDIGRALLCGKYQESSHQESSHQGSS